MKFLRNSLRKIIPNHISILKAVLFIFFVFIILFVTSTSAPNDFEPYSRIKIEDGASIKEVSELLKEKNIIKSKSLFNILVQTSKNQTVASGEYIFEKPASIFRVTERLITAEYGLPTKTVVLTEGMTVFEMAQRLEQTYENFDSELFLKLGTPFEGYLFPSTYKFNINVTAEEVLETLIETFIAKISTIEEELITSDLLLEDIIIMASIVEKEATRDTIQEVTDVLQGRIDADMALQVDAPFVYSIGKGTFDLSMEDLLKDDPYNTYLNKGLPPTPISNPGLESILAAAHPKPTENVYFLTGADGEMYFAQTFEQHKKNKVLYLK